MYAYIYIYIYIYKYIYIYINIYIYIHIPEGSRPDDDTWLLAFRDFKDQNLGPSSAASHDGKSLRAPLWNNDNNKDNTKDKSILRIRLIVPRQMCLCIVVCCLVILRIEGCLHSSL